MGKYFKTNNSGMTLIEVLVSITILGIVLTTFLSFFTQAYSYTKRNQDKTVGINVARNVLYYIEQQEYDAVYANYFSGKKDEVELTIDNCTDSLFEFEDVCKDNLSSTINNVDYSSSIKLTTSENSTNSPDLTNYLINVEVEVSWGDQTATVRGVIKK